jgi:hypothetical protein
MGPAVLLVVTRMILKPTTCLAGIDVHLTGIVVVVAFAL